MSPSLPTQKLSAHSEQGIQPDTPNTPSHGVWVHLVEAPAYYLWPWRMPK